MNDSEAKNRVVMIITVTLCTFLLISLVGAYALAWTDRDPGEVWTKVFDLVSVLAGALVGYIAGTQVEKTRVSRELGAIIKEQKPLSPDVEDEGA